MRPHEELRRLDGPPGTPKTERKHSFRSILGIAGGPPRQRLFDGALGIEPPTSHVVLSQLFSDDLNLCIGTKSYKKVGRPAGDRQIGTNTHFPFHFWGRRREQSICGSLGLEPPNTHVLLQWSSKGDPYLFPLTND